MYELAYHANKELGSCWVRVSGTWATRTYYDFDGTGVMPEGYNNHLRKDAVVYALTGTTGMRSRTMSLNGKELKLGENDELPALEGTAVPAGKLEVAPGGCTFIVL